MVTSIANIILKSKIDQGNLKRHKEFKPWDKIEKIGLIIEKQEHFNKNLVDKFIDDTKKYVEVFFIETTSKVHSYNDWHCFSRKDKSIWNLPNKNKESELKHKKFDAVINTCSESNLFALALSSSLSADLKCGQNNHFNLADLIIKKTEPFNLANYLDETVKYLKMIRA